MVHSKASAILILQKEKVIQSTDVDGIQKKTTAIGVRYEFKLIQIATIPFFPSSFSLNMNAVSKRLLKELREIDKEAASHPQIIELAPISDDDLLHWKAIIAGLPDTPYEGKIQIAQLFMLYSEVKLTYIL